MSKKLFKEIKELLNDLGAVKFLGNELVPNYIEVNYKTKKQAVLDRLEKVGYEVIVTDEYDKDRILQFLVYGSKTPFTEWMKKLKSWCEQKRATDIKKD